MTDYTYTEAQLDAMTKEELVKLGVIAKVVARELPDVKTYRFARRDGMIQSIPIDFERLMKDAVKGVGADAPDHVIVGRAMTLGRGYLDPDKVKAWLAKAKKG